MKKIAVKNEWISVANTFRFIARYPLLILGFLVFIYAQLSGSEGHGGGVSGIIKNSPNALPWAIMLLFVLVAWKWELIGGILITGLGITLLYFFNFTGPHFSLFPFILTIIIIILGSFFIVSWLLRRDKNQTSAERRMKNKRIMITYSAIVIICLTLSGFLAQNRNQKFNVQPDRSVILQPKEGMLVNHQATALGLFSQADSSKDLWLMVRSASSAQYHPQPGPAFKPPRRITWLITVYFGAPEDTPGEQFYLYLFSATDEASQTLGGYLTESQKIGHWQGLKELPAGLMPLDTVTAVRK